MLPATLSASARSLLRLLLQQTPTRRLGCRKQGLAEVREHRFFAGLKWPALKKGNPKSPYSPMIASPTDVSNFVPLSHVRAHHHEQHLAMATAAAGGGVDVPGWDEGF